MVTCEIVKCLLRSCATADRSIESTDEMISSRRLPTPRRNYQDECFPKFVADKACICRATTDAKIFPSRGLETTPPNICRTDWLGAAVVATSAAAAVFQMAGCCVRMYYSHFSRFSNSGCQNPSLRSMKRGAKSPLPIFGSFFRFKRA